MENRKMDHVIKVDHVDEVPEQAINLSPKDEETGKVQSPNRITPLDSSGTAGSHKNSLIASLGSSIRRLSRRSLGSIASKQEKPKASIYGKHTLDIGKTETEMEKTVSSMTNPQKRWLMIRKALKPETIETKKGLSLTKLKGSAEMLLPKTLGLWGSISIILSACINVDIFDLPPKLIQESGSVFASLLIMVSVGILSYCGAMTYAELSLYIKKGGGQYIFIKEVFGNFPAFLYLYIVGVLFIPATIGKSALFTAKKLRAEFGVCYTEDIDTTADRLLAACIILLVMFVNCRSVKFTEEINGISNDIKLMMMTLLTGIIIFELIEHRGEKAHSRAISQPLTPVKAANETDLAQAFLDSMYLYMGWQGFTYMVPEVINPTVNVPRAFSFGMLLMGLFYITMFVIFCTVLSAKKLISTRFHFKEIINHTPFIGPHIGFFAPAFIYTCECAFLFGTMLLTSRLCFFGAQEGHLPKMLGLASYKHYTPIPAVFFIGCTSFIGVMTFKVRKIFEGILMIECIFTIMTAFTVFYFRKKDPTGNRPYMVPLLFPFIYVLGSFLMVFLYIFKNASSVPFVLIAMIIIGVVFLSGKALLSFYTVEIDSYGVKINAFFQKLILGLYLKSTTGDSFLSDDATKIVKMMFSKGDKKPKSKLIQKLTPREPKSPQKAEKPKNRIIEALTHRHPAISKS